MASLLDSVPSALRPKFDRLARRIRLARLLTGFSLLAGLMLAVFLGVFVADRVFALPTAGLRAGFAMFMIAGCLAGIVGLMLPLRWRLDASTLAAIVEKRYPELDERLSSAVELTGSAHGASRLIEMVRADAIERSEPLDFNQAFALGRARKRALVAAGLLLAAVLPALAFPAYSRFGERFFRSWFSPLVGYALEVVPGDDHLAKGRPATITATLSQEDPTVPLPAACFLVFHDAEGPRRVRMQMERDQHTFTFDRLPGDVSYHVEAGELESAVYRINAVEPVDVVSGSPSIEVTPPAYVNDTVHPRRSLEGDFSALQYGVIRFDYKLSRPAVGARVAWHNGDTPTHAKVTWSKTSPEASIEMVAAEGGTFTGSLILEAEHGIVTHVPLPRWKVWRDEAPFFIDRPSIPASAVGTSLETSWLAAPEDPLRLRAAVEDVVGLDSLKLEYRINEGPKFTETLVKADGQLRVAIDSTFPLLGKVKEGDVLRFRLRAADNRKALQDAFAAGVPATPLEPHVVFEPPLKDGKDQWYVLKITKQADPLYKQEIAAQRDDIQRLLEAVKKAIGVERGRLDKAKQAAHAMAFSAEHARQIGEVRGMHKEAMDLLGQLGRKALEAAALEALAELAFDINAQEMTRADQYLEKGAGKGPEAGLREQHLRQADQELVKALGRLEQLAKFNERLAQDRLDQRRMEQLAELQAELAKRAKDLEAMDPTAHPELEKELAKLRAEQDRIATELQKLTQESRLFQESLEKFRVGQAKMLAQQAQKLAQAQRDLADASQDTLMKELRSQLAELAKKQQQLAGKIGKLGEETKQQPPFGMEALQAAEALEGAQVREALQLQAQAGMKLHELGKSIEQALMLGRSPREAALKLAAMQRQIRRDLEKLGEDFPQLGPEKAKARLAEIWRQQKEVTDLTAKFPLPAETDAAKGAKGRAIDETQKTEEYFRTRDAFTAFVQTDEAVKALQALADALPVVPPPDPSRKDAPEEIAARERGKRANALAVEQKELEDAVRKAVEEVLRGSNKADDRLAKLIEGQVELAREASRLAEMTRESAKGSGPAKAAAEMTQKTAEQALAGAFEKAHEMGQKAVGRLQEASKEFAAAKPKTLKSDPAKEAAELARRQEAFNEKFQELARDLAAQKAQQAVRQKELQTKTDELMQDLLKLSQQAADKKGMPGGKEAAQSAMEAGKALENAMKNKDEGKLDQAQEMAKEAALKLELAGKQADDAAQAMQAAMKEQEPNPDAEATAESLQEGKKQVADAQKQLRDGPSAAAQSAMQKAAQAMQKSAQSAGKQMSQSAKNANPNGPKGQDPNRGGAPSVAGIPTSPALAKELEKFSGKSWGDLPGELQTRLLQDLRARFGDDYAPIIQRYFRQIANEDSKK